MKKIFLVLNWLSSNNIKFEVKFIDSTIDKSGEDFNYLIITKTVTFRTFHEGHIVYSLLNNNDYNHSVDFEINDLPDYFFFIDEFLIELIYDNVHSYSGYNYSDLEKLRNKLFKLEFASKFSETCKNENSKIWTDDILIKDEMYNNLLKFVRKKNFSIDKFVEFVKNH